MSNTCIVCLGDLGDDANDPPLTPKKPSPTPPNDDLEVAAVPASPTTDVKPLAPPATKVTEMIAHLLPCAHNLHDDCLKPWVERANSCPICRQSFNMVELSEKIGGPIISSYAVQDRVQVADIDPSMLIEEVDDVPDSQPCPVCGRDDNEDLLLLCDSCDVPTHTYCVGLDDVPRGPWHCEQCQTQRAIALSEPPQTSQDIFPRRTRGQRRRLRTQLGTSQRDWALVWQSIWDTLNLDLDFPFDDEQSADRIIEERRREASNRREFRAWERRFQVAERQGGQNRLGDLLEIGRGRPTRPRHHIATPEPESMDEVRAWNAFERAREIQNAPPSVSRKRSRSPPASPRHEEPAPERRLKRPRTRRPQDLAEAAEQGESSRATRPITTTAPTTTSTDTTAPTAAPSFLQSLLKEVEDSTPTRGNGAYRQSAHQHNNPVDHTSPGPSSPALSPLPSNHSSPRLSATTPPPHARALSPTPLTSTIEPIFPSPEFSPSCSPLVDTSTCTHARCIRIRGRELNEERERIRARRAQASSISPSRHRSDEASPTRAGLSLSAKSEVQQMVKMALKPHYRDQVVDKDQYTDINRRISRMLYERVGVIETLNAEDKAKWEAIATAEVAKAVSALQTANQQQGTTNSD
ncbi:hypothetical protein FQN54_007944 [Arachnomyces sp. PD_36]|nr:hypothetical protein FQN54_007944 [Arachnomyces sp. PD_36]